MSDDRRRTTWPTAAELQQAADTLRATAPDLTGLGAVRALAAVPAQPTKRKGGGGTGDGYDYVVARLYTDPRMTRKTREIALLMAWLIARDPNRFNAGVWQRAEAILGFRQHGRWKQSVAALLVADDIPRYVPEEASGPDGQEYACSAPMIRRAGECGQPARDHSWKADPVTGARTPVWFCRRHAAYGRDCNLTLANAPDPVPNRGGLLPCYFPSRSDTKGLWEQNYKWAAHTADPWLREEWMPPRHGVIADDWPRPGGAPAMPKTPKLQLVAVGGELVDEQTPPAEEAGMT